MDRYQLNKNAEGYTDLTALEGIKRADKDLETKATKEIWKDIKGYEGLYQVSNLGRVKSLRDKNKKYREKILKQYKDNCGYYYITLSANSNIKKHKVHRLVAQAFILNPENKPQVNHIDGNKQNNTVSNLEWCTQEENMKHAYRTGLQKAKKGKDNSLSRKVICIDTGKKYGSTREAERLTGICQSDISKCCRGKKKSAGKHPVTGEKLKWGYVED